MGRRMWDKDNRLVSNVFLRVLPILFGHEMAVAGLEHARGDPES